MTIAWGPYPTPRRHDTLGQSEPFGVGAGRHLGQAPIPLTVERVLGVRQAVAGNGLDFVENGEDIHVPEGQLVPLAMLGNRGTQSRRR